MDNNHLYTGLYVNQSLDINDDLSEIKLSDFRQIICIDEERQDPYPYDTADVYLKGSCQLFAIALNDKFGYGMYELIFDNRMLHTFCITQIADKNVYIDIRGMTTDFNEFKSEFLLDKYKDFTINSCTLEEDKKLQGDKDMLGLAFAKAIIERYPHYYSL